MDVGVGVGVGVGAHTGGPRGGQGTLPRRAAWAHCIVHCTARGERAGEGVARG